MKQKLRNLANTVLIVGTLSLIGYTIGKCYEYYITSGVEKLQTTIEFVTEEEIYYVNLDRLTVAFKSTDEWLTFESVEQLKQWLIQNTPVKNECTFSR